MKLLMTADTVGGVWTYALELARALVPHGVHITLATMGERPTPAQRAEAHACGNVDLIASDFRLEWMDDPWRHVDRAGEWLLRLEAQLTPDVVHLNGFSHAALPFDAPVLLAAHSCVLSWWRAVKGEAAPESWHPYRFRVGQGLLDADIVVAPTRALLDAVLAEHGRIERTRVIPNARAPERFRPGRKEPFVLGVGRLWDEAKNVRALAEVAPELDWPVLVAGWSEDPDGRGVPLVNVQPLGRLDTRALAETYARAGIFVLPALYEPFGLAALEAGLAGCALVLGDVPTLREVWGDAADYVPPRDTRALREVVQRLIRDDAYRRARAAAAHARALDYGPERHGRAYMEVYDALLRGTRLEAVACAS